MLEYVDEDQLADFLGGKNTHKLEEDFGPWKDYEIVDGAKADSIVGIRPVGTDGDPIFTPKMMEALPNPKISEEANITRQALLGNAGVTATGKDEEKKSA